MTLSVRPYRPEDRAACAFVFYRAVREGAASFYDNAQLEAWAPSPEPTPGTPDKHLGQWCWVAERGGAVVGFMSIEPSGYLDMAFVLPEEMGEGAAKALYESLIARSRAEGLARLTVTASHLARRFFARQGWVVDRKEDLAAGGQIYEIFRMSLELPPTGMRNG